MSDMSAIQQATQKLQPLLTMIGVPNDQSALLPNVPMPTDSAFAQQQSPSYFRSLETLLHAASPAADQIVRGSSGGYTAQNNTNRSQRDGDPNAKTQDAAVGLGLFNPRTFMAGRDGDSQDQGQGQGQQQRGQSSVAASSAIQLVQMLQAQQVMNNQGSFKAAYVTPIRKDAVDFTGPMPPNMVNTFNQLMKELVNRLAGDLNEQAEASPVEGKTATELLAKVPNGLTAEPTDIKTIVQKLEDAISYRLLMQNQEMQQQDQTNGVVEAAGLVLKTLVAKLQTGEIEPSPQVMATIVEALEGIIELNPELIHSGVGQRLQAMRSMLASMRAQGNHNEPVAAEAEESEEESPNLESTGWQTGADQTPVQNDADTLSQPKAYDTVASGTIDSNGKMSGVGFSGGDHESFNYKLTANANGMVNILNGAGNQNGGFVLQAKADRDDRGNTVALVQGDLSWNGGKEGIRLNSDGSSQVTNNGGKGWLPLSNGEKSRYASSDGRYSAVFDPIDREVRFTERDAAGRGIGSATIKADGEGVSFANLSLKLPANIG